MTNTDFVLVAKRGGETRIVSEGEAVGHSMEDEDVSWIYMIGECESCGAVNVLEGDFVEVGSEERPQGTETFYSSRMYAECEACGEEMKAVAEFSEYPKGPIHPYELKTERNVEYTEINGLSQLVE